MRPCRYIFFPDHPLEQQTQERIHCLLKTLSVSATCLVCFRCYIIKSQRRCKHDHQHFRLASTSLLRISRQQTIQSRHCGHLS